MCGRKGRRGWGRIRQLPNKSKRYQASYIWPPNTTARHNALTTFSTRALAEQWLANERRLIERDEWTAPRDRNHREVVRAQTFGDYVARWIEERNIADSSKSDYRRHLKVITETGLAAIPLRSLDAAKARTWRSSLDTTDNGKFKIWMFLHSVCATAVGDGLLSPNPFGEKMKKPAVQVEVVYLDPPEVAAAADVIRPRFRAPALIANWCGLRWGELGELRRKDISADAKVIRVARGHRHEEGCHIGTVKQDKPHDVVVPPHIRADIKHHLDTYVDEDPEALLLKGHCKCGHLSDATFRGAWHKALKSIGVPAARLHDMKHFAGTQTAHTGADLKEIMDRLGHSTPGASLIYQGIARGRQEDIAEALSALAVGA